MGLWLQPWCNPPAANIRPTQGRLWGGIGRALLCIGQQVVGELAGEAGRGGRSPALMSVQHHLIYRGVSYAGFHGVEPCYNLGRKLRLREVKDFHLGPTVGMPQSSGLLNPTWDSFYHTGVKTDQPQTFPREDQVGRHHCPCLWVLGQNLHHSGLEGSIRVIRRLVTPTLTDYTGLCRADNVLSTFYSLF